MSGPSLRASHGRCPMPAWADRTLSPSCLRRYGARSIHNPAGGNAMPLDSQSTTLWVQPTGGPLGADVHGIDLSREIDAGDAGGADRRLVAPPGAALLRPAARRRGADALQPRCGASSTACRSAPASRRPTAWPPRPREWVTVISNVKVGGKPIGGLGAYESVWHVDMSYNPLPPRASLLYAIECPPSRRRHRLQQHGARLRDAGRRR